MTVSTFLYTKSNTSLGGHAFDGVLAMLLVIDNAVDTTATARKARAVTVARAAGRALPAGYFDVEASINAAPTTENLHTAGDYTIVSKFEVQTVAAGAAEVDTQEQV